MFDPLRFLSLARELSSGDEARLRTSVSRAYYSSFLVARERLGLTRERVPEVHRTVIEELGARNRPAGVRLHRLRRMRNIADYDLSTRIESEDAAMALELAERIIDWFGA
jgi:uncharacterized protein (UPF0332 family)